MAYKGKTRHIRDALVTLLQGVTYDAGGGSEPAFGLVTADPSQEFTTEPFCLVYPAMSQDVKGATGQNDRTAAFAIFVMLNMETGTRTQAQTYNYMSDLTDLILDALDEGDFNDSLNISDNTLGTWLMDASRSDFRPAETKGAAVLLCSIDVAITYSKNL